MLERGEGRSPWKKKMMVGRKNLGSLFVKELVRATSWGTVFLFAVLVLALGARQNIKEAIDFSFKRAGGEIFYLARSPEVKQDVKEAIDLWHTYKYKKLEPTGNLTTGQ